MKILYRTKRYGKWIPLEIPEMEKELIGPFLLKNYAAIEWKKN